MPQMYKKSGGNVWNNKFKTNEKQPKFTGDIFIDSDVLRDMVIYAKNNTTPEDPEHINKAKVKVALWERDTKKGDPYVYIQLEAVPTETSDAPPPVSAPPVNAPPSSVEFDDEIPF